MMRHPTVLLLAIGMCVVSVVPTWAAESKAAKKAKPVRANSPMAKIEDDPQLPRVLLIGDSISIGYTVPVREFLTGKANVHRPSANCGPTTRGLESIDAWLGEKPWDVIHFNWGLHDLKYMGANGENLADPAASTSHQQVPPAEYEKNLRRLVQRMKKSGKVLIWCSTTPVPEGCSGRIPGDSAKYNEIAAKVMMDEGVQIHDLYAFAKPRLAEIQLPANVHFSAAGSRELAKQVANTIEGAVKKTASSDSSGEN